MRVPDLRSTPPAAPPPRAEAPARDGAPQPIRDQLATAPVAVVGDVAVDLADVDGLAHPGNDDLRGTAKGQVALDREYLLSRLRDFTKSDAKKAITRIAFDASRRTYAIAGHAKLFGRWRGPGFNVEMTADKSGHLLIKGSSWADPILRLFGQPTVTDWVERSIAAAKAPLKTRRDGKTLILAGIANLTVPLGSENIKLTLSDYTPRAGNPGPFGIAPDGRVITGLEGEVRGFIWHGKPTGPSENPDRATLQVHFVGRADKSVSTRVTGSATVGITEEQLKNLTGQRGAVLFPLLKSGRARFTGLEIEGTYTDLRRWDSRISGNARIETPQGLTIETPFSSVIDDAGKGVVASAGPVAWHDPFNGSQRIEKIAFEHGPDGIRLDVADPPDAPVTVPFAANRLGLWVGGDEYYRNLLAVVGKAEHGVMLETFGYPEGERTAHLMEGLLARAAAGVKVRLLVDPGPFGTENWAGRVQATLAGKGDDAWTKRFMAGKRPEEIAAIRENLRVQDHPGGLARTNHRKVVVIDGILGITGGINVGDSHFAAVQDAMVPTIGPAVRTMAEDFLRTWSEDGGKLTEADRAAFIKPDEPIAGKGTARFGHLVAAGSSPSRVLVTDDRQAEIAGAYLEAIDGARKTVKVEQQYLTERRVVEALEKAVRRGVAITVVVPEDQDGEFELGNNLAILRLLKASAAPAAGKVDLRYYQTRGTWSHHVHSKILVADGERALVGSANVDQRAMRGLATTPKGRLLWNKELDLDVADPAFAAQVDRKVFLTDAQRSESRDVWEKIAAMRIESAARPRERGLGKPLGTLSGELQAAYRAEVALALQAAGQSPEEAAARNALQAALARTESRWSGTWQRMAALSAAASQAAQAYKDDPARAEARLRALQHEAENRVREALPEGRGRDVELHLLQGPFGDLLAQLRKNPDGASWFVERLSATWALATAHAALYDLEGAVGTTYRAGGFARHAEWVTKALRPDETKARLSEAFNILF